MNLNLKTVRKIKEKFREKTVMNIRILQELKLFKLLIQLIDLTVKMI